MPLPYHRLLTYRGKKRYFEYVVQGRFTREVAFQSVFTGQSCPAPLPYQPSRWLISALHAFQPSVLICAEGDRPYFLSPLMSTMQRVGE
ncbi:hypothetical protein EON64_10190 [archaeon]|nr:MAG: hypothetical protein EON64_10190 [archaeon]